MAVVRSRQEMRLEADDDGAIEHLLDKVADEAEGGGGQIEMDDVGSRGRVVQALDNSEDARHLGWQEASVGFGAVDPIRIKQARLGKGGHQANLMTMGS